MTHELDQRKKDAILSALLRAADKIQSGEDPENVMDYLQTIVWNQRKTNTKSRNTGHMVSEIGIAS